LNKPSLLAVIMLTTLLTHTIIPMPQEALEKGFVNLVAEVPSIQVSLRYNSPENFVGKPVDGYKENIVLVTKPTADAIKKVQEALNKDGYGLVIYDAYRPQQAVDNFMRWSKDSNDQVKKDQYYPRVDKKDVFKLGYVAEKSGHSRGSTIDLTIIKLGNNVQPITEEKRTLKDGFEITYLNDGTVDMGSSFDLFDEASHYKNKLISQEHQERRDYLKNVMERHGFKNYAEEWWHFTLAHEPYKNDKESSYFNFPVTSKKD
jgi:D-alanyl-D-alanine dipeptidase